MDDIDNFTVLKGGNKRNFTIECDEPKIYDLVGMWRPFFRLHQHYTLGKHRWRPIRVTINQS